MSLAPRRLDRALDALSSMGSSVSKQVHTVDTADCFDNIHALFLTH